MAIFRIPSVFNALGRSDLDGISSLCLMSEM